MQERPDDDASFEGLDRLFRKSAEEFEPSYDPAAWTSMSDRLDEHDRIAYWGQWLRRSLGVLALLVLIGVGWYGYRESYEQKTPVQRQPALPNTPDSTIISAGKEGAIAGRSSAAGTSRYNLRNGVNPKETEAALSAPSVTRLVRPTRLPDQSRVTDAKSQTADRLPVATKLGRRAYSFPKEGRSVATHDDIAGQQKQDQPMYAEASQNRRLRWPVVRQPSFVHGTSQLTRTATAVKRSNRQGQVRSTTVGLREQVAMVETSDEAGSSLPPDGSALATTTEPIEPGSTASVAVAPVAELASRSPMRWPKWPTIAAPAFVVPEVVATNADAETPIRRERGLSVRLAIAPDLSAVGIHNFTRPGTNVGLLAEYRFANRWSAQIGVIRSNKVYTALPEEYSWPSKPYLYVMPTGVNGQCAMFDLPINLRYDVWAKATGPGMARWFVSGGATTYIMQREQYDFVYENPADPRIKLHSWSGKTGGYVFSNLNLSVGYERSFTRRLSWQVEPFVKTSLTGVGYFNVNLFSTGAFFSIRYKL